MKNKKQTKNIKVIVAVLVFIVALGVIGQADYDSETRPSVCRDYKGSTVCYKP